MVLRPAGRDPLVPLVLGTAVLMASGSVIFTLLPAMQTEIGFPTWGFGLIAGTFFLFSLIAQLTLSRLADSGEAKLLLLSAIVVGVAGLVWMALATSLWQLVAARGLSGFAAGAWGPAARAVVIVGHGKSTGRRLGYVASGETGGLVVGPLIGSLLAAWLSSDAAFVGFALLVVLLVPMVARVAVAESDEPTSEAPRPWRMIRRKPVQQAAALAVILFSPVGLYETIWGKYVLDLGGSTFIIGLSVAMYGLPYALIAPLGGRLGDRVGPFRVALAGTGFLAVVTVLTGLPRNLWVLLPIGVVEAVISSVAYPNALSAMSRACTPREQATGQGIAGGAALAGAGVMALIAGPLFDRFGPATTFAVTGALVAGGGLVIRLRRRGGEIGSGSIEGEREGGDPATVGL